MSDTDIEGNSEKTVAMPLRFWRMVRALAPRPLAAWSRRVASWPPVGGVEFGDLRKFEPIGRNFFQRGQPIDRYYIESFLDRSRAFLRGDVLEFGDGTYIRRFADGDARAHVLSVDETATGAAVIRADLQQPQALPAEAFDAIICTQTLQMIYDCRTAVANLHRALRPGGTLLVTAHGIVQLSRWDMDRWGEHWRFTSRSLRRLLEETFPPSAVVVKAYGNVLAATAALHNLAADELTQAELDHVGSDYEVLITAEATKPEAEG